MRKLLLVVLIGFFSFEKIYAIENIKINNESLSPLFDKDTYVYNYYTNENEIIISVEKTKNENVSGYGIFTLNDEINKFNITVDDKIYEINVYKNYKEDTEEKITFKYFNIDNYNIDFNNDILEYSITLNDEEYLNFNYDLDDYTSNVYISGNGNFKDGNNDIKIKIVNKSESDSKEYIIHAYKNKRVINTSKERKTLTETENNILLISIIIFSSIAMVVSFYFICIKEHTLLK